MDFFDHQEKALRKSRQLVAYFLASVVLIVLSVYIAALIVFTGFASRAPLEGPSSWWNPLLFLWVTALTITIIVAGSLYKILQLSGGGKVVAERLGGRLVEPNSPDLQERRLLNVVQEMAIASGVPVPSVYLLESDDSINAFAAGYTPGDAVVAVTRGTLQMLTRDELQGVIAHEFSHILNGDMRLNIRLMGMLHGILVIALIGYTLMRSTRRSSREKNGGSHVLLFGLALYVIGYIGVFFGKLIKSAVSRQREYLADASAVQFTRDPSGIAGALKKIGGLLLGSRLQSPNAEEASHLFFADALSRGKGRARGEEGPGQRSAAPPTATFAFLSTHPPLSDRILRIDPSFDGRFPRVPPPGISDSPEDRQEAGAARPGLEGPGPEQALPILPDQMVGKIGVLTPALLSYASELLGQLPAALTTLTQEPSGARAVIFALLLSRQTETRRRQFKILEESGEHWLSRETLEASTHVDRCPPQARLPLIDLSLPALKELSASQYVSFMSLVDRLVAADEKVELFETTLLHLLKRHLSPTFKKTPPPPVRYRSLAPLYGEVSLLLSLLAAIGNEEDPEEAGRAFRSGVAQLEEPAEKIPFQPRLEWEPAGMSQALDRLSLASPQLKRGILMAMSGCVTHDGVVTPRERELLRAIADAFDCPMPPFE